MKKLLIVIISVMVIFTACMEEKGNDSLSTTVELTVTPSASPTPKPLSEKAVIDKVDCGFSQASASAVYFNEQLYFLSATTTNEQGEEGCYLNSESEKDILWMPYRSFGRGIYVSNNELYLLTHDNEMYSLSSYSDGKVDKAVDIAKYTGTLEKENILGTCIRMTSDYVYVLSKTEVKNEYPSEFAIYGLELVRFSLADGKMEQVKKVENNEILTRYICSNYNVNDNYVSYLLATYLYDPMRGSGLDTDMIEVLDSKDFNIANSVQSVARQYVLDNSGNLYYSFTQNEVIGSNEYNNECKLCVKKVDEEAKLICMLEEGHLWGEYNTYFDGENFILDNCQLSDGENIKRQIVVVDIRGKVVKEYCLVDNLPEMEEATLELATALFCYNGRYLIEIQGTEKNEKILLNISSDEITKMYRSNSIIEYSLVEIPVNKIYDDDSKLGFWASFSGINGGGYCRYGDFHRVEAEYLDLDGVFEVSIENHGIIFDSDAALIGESKAAVVTTDRDNMFACDKIRVFRNTSFTIEDGSEHTINEEDWYKCRYNFSSARKTGMVNFARGFEHVIK